MFTYIRFILYFGQICITLQWHHNELHGVSNHRHIDCLLNHFSGAHQRQQQSSESLAFVRGIHPRPMDSPNKGPVTRKMFWWYIVASCIIADVANICYEHPFVCLLTKTDAKMAMNFNNCSYSEILDGAVLVIRSTDWPWDNYWHAMKCDIRIGSKGFPTNCFIIIHLIVAKILPISTRLTARTGVKYQCNMENCSYISKIIVFVNKVNCNWIAYIYYEIHNVM